MNTYEFTVSYTGHTTVLIEGASQEDAREDLQASLEFELPGTLDSYTVLSVTEVV